MAAMNSNFHLNGRADSHDPLIAMLPVLCQFNSRTPPSYDSNGFTDCSLVDALGVRYTFLNFGEEKSPGSPNLGGKRD